MSTSETATRVVTLVVVYGSKAASPAVVRIKLDRKQAIHAVAHSQKDGVSCRPFHGLDVNDNPFTVDVGTAASAVYIEE